jgi:hypothetical protein
VYSMITVELAAVALFPLMVEYCAFLAYLFDLEVESIVVVVV